MFTSRNFIYATKHTVQRTRRRQQNNKNYLLKTHRQLLRDTNFSLTMLLPHFPMYVFIFSTQCTLLLPLHRASMQKLLLVTIVFFFRGVFYGRPHAHRWREKMGAKCKSGNIWIDKWLLKLCWNNLKHCKPKAIWSSC